LIVNRGIERNELAKKSKQLKDEKEILERRFITFVSHQLQSPLVAVQQYLEVLNYIEDSPHKIEIQKEWINRSLTRIKELHAIVKDWLTISKIESGSYAECSGSVSLKPIIDEIFNTYIMLTEKQNIKLISEVPDNFCPVFGSNECVKMLLENLVHNAIKYNRKNGTVKIYGSIEQDMVLINIKDSGFGIPPDKLEIIFEDFYRVKNDSTKNISGTGLGLPICKKIVTELGGNIAVQSTINEGSTFQILLPKDKD
jgi:signal transduction histidine kinase